MTVVFSVASLAHSLWQFQQFKALLKGRYRDKIGMPSESHKGTLFNKRKPKDTSLILAGGQTIKSHKYQVTIQFGVYIWQQVAWNVYGSHW